MKTLNAKLADCLEVEGWDLVKSHTQDLDWWADEIWQLKSRWSPTGADAFVTFLVDPMWQRDRKKGQGVWAVGCCASYPRDRQQAEQGGILREKASKDAIEEFVQLVNSLRK